MKISAIILARNEERKIEKAVTSLLFCDEVLVIDDESSDDTPKIAEKAGAKVLIHSKKNEFSGQRNWAMEQAKNDWILFIDADEEVSHELKSELFKLQIHTGIASYAIPRRDYFWNREMKYGETQKARTQGIVRLIKKGSGVWTGAVHETFTASGKVEKLHSFLNHYSHDSISSFVTDINFYSTIRVLELAKEGKKVSGFEIMFFPLGKFLYTYFVLRGFLDGSVGFVYSFIMSFHSFLVRAKLATQTYV